MAGKKGTTNKQPDDLLNNKDLLDNKETTISESNSYDDFPYVSFPFAHTRPEYLKTIGTLFGMTPPAIETARVLELGSASGGNIINFAETYPSSYTLGIDLSREQIQQGTKVVEQLGLKNIDLKHLSITEIDQSYGKFDYIICHGVFSWVPKEVQDKILSICKDLLTPQGIAYVSYNTLPGWNMLNSIRDMMLYHSSMFSDNMDKIQQAKLFIDFVNDSLEGTNSSYSQFLKEEAEGLAEREDSYIRHEHLSANNKQFYFHEFIKLASAHNLSYIGEASIYAMYLGNMPQRAAEKLQDIKDIVRTEQYMDFIQNRRFRCTLLCHDNIAFDRNITPEILNKFYMTCDMLAEKLITEVDLENVNENLVFKMAMSKSQNISTSSAAIKAIMYSLIENKGNPLKLGEIFKLAQKKLKTKNLTMESELNNIIGKLVFSGYIKLFADKPQAINIISDKPKVSHQVRLQAQNPIGKKHWVTSQTNEIVLLEIYDSFLISRLDGTNNFEDLTKFMIDSFTNGDIVVSKSNPENELIIDPNSFKDIAQECIKLSLERFRKNYLLIA